MYNKRPIKGKRQASMKDWAGPDAISPREGRTAPPGSLDWKHQLDVLGRGIVGWKTGLGKRAEKQGLFLNPELERE